MFHAKIHIKIIKYFLSTHLSDYDSYQYICPIMIPINTFVRLWLLNRKYFRTKKDNSQTDLSEKTQEIIAYDKIGFFPGKKANMYFWSRMIQL